MTEKSAKIMMFTKYGQLAASSRIRSLQYVPYLRANGIAVDWAPLFDDRMLSIFNRGGRRPMTGIVKAYMRRFLFPVNRGGYDLYWIEKELFPYVPFRLESILARLGAPYVLDYDDAIFHNYDRHPSPVVRALLGRKIDRVMRSSSLVIAGNDYLAARAASAGASRVAVLPSVVDLSRYPPSPPPERGEFVIGWIGSPSTGKYLEIVEEALRQVCKRIPARLVVVGARPAGMQGIPCDWRSWSEETENEDIAEFDVGIMPLADGPWERGKCSYKLIQYMACARPVVASPVGMNTALVEDGVNGYFASGTGEWIEALLSLYADRRLREHLGQAGRRKVEKEYSLQITAPKLLELLRETLSAHKRGIDDGKR